MEPLGSPKSGPCGTQPGSCRNQGPRVHRHTSVHRPLSGGSAQKASSQRIQPGGQRYTSPRMGSALGDWLLVALAISLPLLQPVSCVRVHLRNPRNTHRRGQTTVTAQCDNARYWYPNGREAGEAPTSKYGYKSTASTSQFQPGPCLQVSGLHIVQTYKKTILNIDRSDADNSLLRLPSGRIAYAEEIRLDPAAGAADYRGATQRPLDVLTNTFCSAGATDSNGDLFSIAGSYTGSYSNTTGFFSIRKFSPCDPGGACDFSIVAQLTSKRWYPTAQLLGDGRIFIVGGSNDSTYMSWPNVNNPTFEYYTPNSKSTKSVYLDFLSRTSPYNLYPFVHLLPSGRVFIFSSQNYILFDTSGNREIPGSYPALDKKDAYGFPIFRSYPATGTSALFPLTPAENFVAEIMICGGTSSKAANQNRKLADPRAPADSSCYRIKPEVANPAWQEEKMCKDPRACSQPYPRVMGDAVLLADGSVLIINGAEQGYQGLPMSTYVPALQPLLYKTKERTWYTTQLAISKIPRGYHSSALLLHDGTVFVTGSNPNQPSNLTQAPFPTEFRSEVFYPPYWYDSQPPVLATAPASIAVNKAFTITFQAYRADPTPFANRFSVVLAYPGFSTHSSRHGMRNVVLQYKSASSSGNTVTLTVLAPQNLNIAPATYYWLFVLDRDTPCREAKAVKLTP